MEEKKLIQALGFKPKENTSGIFHKKYNSYAIEIDFEKKQFDFGSKITAGRETTQNFSQQENWVVLECVDRLLEKGYKPENIILEKKYKVGHGASGGWLDILVTRKDGSAYLMIECKTWGKEFDKEFNKTEKDGGQLMTYFQQDKSADILMLYASQLDKNKVQFRNEIIKIEDHYRQAGNVEDVFDRWNKVTNTNGIFDDWVKPYLFESKKLTKEDLKTLNEEDSKKIFHEFLSILRKHSVSDKPNAFNKIFNLFLAKIFDEKKRDNKELDFQWKEHKDNAVDFQIRLINLYKSGMYDFLKKEVRGISDDMFSYKTQKELEEKKKHILLFNKVYDIKDVFDEETFEDNQKVLKEVVQLLQKFRIRYPRKQQHLSDFFERLLTTGLKQEAGQFFTPPPITRFITRSLPISQYIKKQLNQSISELPAVIDYSVGSGHFLTEVMEEYQRVIEQDIDTSKLETQEAEDFVEVWRKKKYDWASKYVYGIEKDYRLVKVAKVGCYFYGDGLAQVIHGDGLDNFKHSKSYRGLLKKNAEKPQFSFIVSNPPYSVSSFKGDLKNTSANQDFKLFDSLTDRSSEIECLFIERTKQLLKTDGIAAIILPSSILSNSGIYAQAREVILKSFDVIAITELGSATFMATGTNTVTLFLKRREDTIAEQVEKSLTTFFTNLKDITINGIEKPIAKYLAHVWEDVAFEDYKTLLQKKPNDAVKQHEIFKEYDKKIKAKKEEDKWAKILEVEKEKLLYFILSFSQKVVLVKTGQKKKEKQFLGYEFSNRRGSEGMHPIQRSKTIDECTQLYDTTTFENPEKASTYIHKAFTEDKFDLEIPKSLKENISYQSLIDMLTFDRADFEKNISLTVKKKVIIPSKYKQVKVESVFTEIKNGKNVKQSDLQGKYRVSRIESIADGEFDIEATKWTNDKVNEGDFLQKGDFLFSHINSVWYIGKTGYFNLDEKIIHGVNLLRFRSNKELICSKYGYEIFNQGTFIEEVQKYAIKAANQASVNTNQIKALKIPLPPKDIQQKIVDEIEVLERQEEKAVESIENLRSEIKSSIQYLSNYPKSNLGIIAENWDNKRKPVTKGDRTKGKYPYYGASGIVDYVSNYLIDDTVLLISEDGANLKSRVSPIAFTAKGKIWVNNHAHVLKFDNSSTHKLVEVYINLADISDYITGQAQPKLNQKNLNSIKIPLPPLKEQEKIASEIEKLEKKINELEKQIVEIPKQKAAILKKYLE